MQKKVLITGITGQDGSYLSEFLLEKGYEVHGIVRRVAFEDPTRRFGRIAHILPKIKLHAGSVESGNRILEIVDEVKPDECYHLAAQSFVHESFDDAHTTFSTNIDGTLVILNTLKKRAPQCKFYFAGSSEMFGQVHETPQRELTPFHPRSPYGVSKVAGFDLTRNFRESYGMHASSGILFNHESPRRGHEFVTRKITSSIPRLLAKKENMLLLGNLDAKRDWGFAGDYVKAMWLMLQQPVPDDYVVATGENHSIREFIDLAFQYANITPIFIDLHTLSEEDADKKVQELKNEPGYFVVQHPRFYRPAEVQQLLGDAYKARKTLKWEPETSFNDLVKMMVESDCAKKEV